MSSSASGYSVQVDNPCIIVKVLHLALGIKLMYRHGVFVFGPKEQCIVGELAIRPDSGKMLVKFVKFTCNLENEEPRSPPLC